MKRIFVSYSRKNKAFAERLARDLSDAGLDVWIDFRNIQGGERWQEEIFRGVSQADIFIVCLSPAAIASEWVRREIFLARGQQKLVVPLLVEGSFADLEQHDETKWLLNIQIINFDGRYEQAFPELLASLPGLTKPEPEDIADETRIPNPFKGLEAFQQTDAHLFFGREDMIRRSLDLLRKASASRFLAVVGASGSGKSSLVRAGVIPALRSGALPGSANWPIIILLPGAHPMEALITRLQPLLGENRTLADVTSALEKGPEALHQLTEEVLSAAPAEARLLLVVDQFEEVFTRSSENEARQFLDLLHTAVTAQGGRTLVIITMRADFFDRLSHYPNLASLFEQPNLVIVTEMTPANLRRAIEGPAQAVGLVYDAGLPERILEDVRYQPGSLPLLQYALKELYERREGRRLTMAAYEAIGGVQQALAQHAENIYVRLNVAQQDIMRRVLLRLIEVSETGEVTRRKVLRNDLTFQGVTDEAVQEVIDLLTAAESRLLIASREINLEEDASTEPPVWIEISHEALVRQWERFTSWVAEQEEVLRTGSELLKEAQDWQRAGRDTAYLLTGTRLERALNWLDQADANALQRAFIQASVEERERREAVETKRQQLELELQRRAARRLRYIVLLLLVFLVVAMVLTLAALNSENRAVEALDRANRNAAEAQSLALAASAEQAASGNNNDLALALALEANNISSPPAEAGRVLAEVAYAPGTRRLLLGHTDEVWAVAFSPDGRIAISGSRDNRVILWDLETGTPINTFAGHSDDVMAVAFSPDGTRALSGSRDNTLILWDIASGQALQRFEGHTNWVRGLAFSPDGQTALSASRDKTLILWDLQTGQAIRTFTGHRSDVFAVAFSPSGVNAISGSRDNTLILWDVNAGLAIGQPFEGHTSAVTSVAFSPDRAHVVSGSDDNSLILWDVAGSVGTQIRRYEGHTGAVLSVAFSPDGRQILSGSDDSTMRLWDVETGAELTVFRGHNARVSSVAFSPDGQRALTASGDSTLRLWDLQNRAEIRRFSDHNAKIINLGLSPDGRTIYSAAGDGTAIVWDTVTDQRRSFALSVPGAVLGATSNVAFSADGSRAVSVSTFATSSQILVWDLTTGQSVTPFDDVNRIILSVAISPDGTRVLSGGRDDQIVLQDIRNGDEIRTFIGHQDEVQSVAFSPDGRRAISGAADSNVILWDVATGEEIRRFTEHSARVLAVAFSPDGRYILSGGGDNSLRLWDAANGEEIVRFSGHTNRVTNVAFNPQGGTVLSGSDDNTVRLWDIVSGTEIRRFDGHGDGVTSVAFTPDGRTAISGSDDRTLRLWQTLTLNELIAWTYANRFVAELTCAEREQHRIRPYCDESGIFPTRTPFPLPTATPGG